jgi:hypothetical protein
MSSQHYHDGRAWYLIGFVRDEQGDRKGSMEAYRKCMEYEVDNGHGDVSLYNEMAKTRIAELEAEQDFKGTHRGTEIQVVVTSPPQIRVKVDCDGIYMMLVVASNITYDSLVGRIDSKMVRFTYKSIALGTVQLRYRGKYGFSFAIESDKDIQRVFEQWQASGWGPAFEKRRDIELFCTSVAEVNRSQKGKNLPSLKLPLDSDKQTLDHLLNYYEGASFVLVPSRGQQKPMEPAILRQIQSFFRPGLQDRPVYTKPTSPSPAVGS